MGTLLITLTLLAAVALIIRGIVRDKQKGRSSCGCGCSHCAASGTCHKGK